MPGSAAPIEPAPSVEPAAPVVGQGRFSRSISGLAAVSFLLCLLPGVLGAQNFDESFCTDQLQFSQPPALTVSLVAEATCESCADDAQVVADSFFVFDPMVVTEVVLWGWYFPNNTPPPIENWTVLFHSDPDDFEPTAPTQVISAEIVTDPIRTATSRSITFGGIQLDEQRWRLRLDRPVRLEERGYYWMEAYHDSPVVNADTSIAQGFTNPLNGNQGVAVSSNAPGSAWGRAPDRDLAFQVCGYSAAWDGLLVPGYEIDLDNPDDRVLFAVRNTRDFPIDIRIAYYGKAEPQFGALRVDELRLDPNQTFTTNPVFDTAGLDPDGNRLLEGYLVVSEATGGTENIEGDFVRVDFENNFATGARMISPEDFCQIQELRVADFGSGSQVRYAVREAVGAGPSFSMTVYDEPGNEVAEVDFFIDEPIGSIQVEDVVQNFQFGTLVFDFSRSGGGVVTGISSALGRFSTETKGACRDLR